MTTEPTEKIAEERSEIAVALRRLGLFLVLAVTGLLVAHFSRLGEYLTVEAITGLADRMGRMGPFFLVLVAVITPFLFLPRWPIAFLAGLLYGITWGTALATLASTLGAWLHFMMSRTLLAPMSNRLRRRYGLDHLEIPREKQFMVLFILRAFPISSFVVTNLVAGALMLSRSRFVLASMLGMIPTSIMYAAWGKLMKKPDAHFYTLAVVALIFILVGSVVAQRYLRPWLRPAPSSDRQPKLPASAD